MDFVYKHKKWKLIWWCITFLLVGSLSIFEIIESKSINLIGFKFGLIFAKFFWSILFVLSLFSLKYAVSSYLYKRKIIGDTKLSITSEYILIPALNKNEKEIKLLYENIQNILEFRVNGNPGYLILECSNNDYKIERQCFENKKLYEQAKELLLRHFERRKLHNN